MNALAYSFHRDTVEKDRMDFIAAGNVDGFMAAEISSRVFAVAPHIVVAICDVQHFPNRTPFRLVSLMPGVWLRDVKPNAPEVAAAVRDLRGVTAVELLPPKIVT